MLLDVQNPGIQELTVSVVVNTAARHAFIEVLNRIDQLERGVVNVNTDVPRVKMERPKEMF